MFNFFQTAERKLFPAIWQERLFDGLRLDKSLWVTQCHPEHEGVVQFNGRPGWYIKGVVAQKMQNYRLLPSERVARWFEINFPG